MTKREDGGPAFPQSDLSSYGMGPSEINNGGMSLRDWFSGQALAGVLASKTFSNSGPGFEDFIATYAFNVADAMLKAREVSHDQA